MIHFTFPIASRPAFRMGGALAALAIAGGTLLLASTAMAGASDDDTDPHAARSSAQHSDEGGGQRVDERRPLNPDGHLFVSNVAGSLRVQTWDRSEVQVSGELGEGVDKLELSGDAANLSIIVRLPKHSHHSGNTDLLLNVPVGAQVALDTVSADVAVQGSQGPVSIKTVSGDVGLQLASPEVQVQTVSGDLTLVAPSRDTRVNSVSGDLHMSGVRDRLVAETVSGNVQLSGGAFSELRLTSVSGDMHLDVSLADHAEVRGSTLSGDITLVVPGATNGTAELKSFSGDTECQGGKLASVSSGRRHEYFWGDGSGTRIDLSSFSGDIRLERK